MNSERAAEFDEAYFAAGPVRSSRELTHSVHESIVLSWVRKHRPEILEGNGKRALEIGCGFGYAAELFADEGYFVVGTDIAPHAVERARREVSRPDIEFRVWDATTRAPFVDRFHLIAAFEVVEHLHDPEAALASWHDLLEPGGALLLSTPNLHGPASRHWRDPTHVNVRTARHWKRAVASSGRWREIDVAAVQWLPFTWRLHGRMRAVPVPVVGAELRICAIKA